MSSFLKRLQTVEQLVQTDIPSLPWLTPDSKKIPIYKEDSTPGLTSFSDAGLDLLSADDVPAQRTLLGLGTAATKNVGSGSNNVAPALHAHANYLPIDGAVVAVAYSGSAQSLPSVPYKYINFTLNGINCCIPIYLSSAALADPQLVLEPYSSAGMVTLNFVNASGYSKANIFTNSVPNSASATLLIEDYTAVSFTDSVPNFGENFYWVKSTDGIGSFSGFSNFVEQTIARCDCSSIKCCTTYTTCDNQTSLN